jgi:hypothetical protein
MSPEVREFALAPEQLEKIQSVSDLYDRFNEMPHNFSNTARTQDKLNQYLPATVTATVSMLLSHDPMLSGGVGFLTKYLSKDAPDAARLAMLKFLGSTKEINSGALKGTADFINSMMRGEHILARGAKNLFVAGKDVLPPSVLPTDKDRTKLDKQLQAYQKDPNLANQVGGGIGHYMEDHSQSLAQTAGTAITALNQARPSSAKKNPLDAPTRPNPVQKAAYDRTLNIAQQPLVVLKHIQDGTLTSSDVLSVKSLYPAVYARLSQKLVAEMSEATAKGQSIPYKTRLGLSMFLGQPLDSTMTPQAIISAQPVPKAPPQLPAKGGKANALGKGAKGAMTPGQAAEQDRADRS